MSTNSNRARNKSLRKLGIGVARRSHPRSLGRMYRAVRTLGALQSTVLLHTREIRRINPVCDLQI